MLKKKAPGGKAIPGARWGKRVIDYCIPQARMLSPEGNRLQRFSGRPQRHRAFCTAARTPFSDQPDRLARATSDVPPLTLTCHPCQPPAPSSRSRPCQSAEQRTRLARATSRARATSDVPPVPPPLIRRAQQGGQRPGQQQQEPGKGGQQGGQDRPGQQQGGGEKPGQQRQEPGKGGQQGGRGQGSREENR